jgi:hypothetical protein
MNQYNGWANYATWRVNLEIFDGMSASDLTEKRVNCASEVKDVCAEYAENLIEEASQEGLARDYARAFLSDVDWWEIANHLMADEDEEETEEETEEEGAKP